MSTMTRKQKMSSHWGFMRFAWLTRRTDRPLGLLRDGSSWWLLIRYVHYAPPLPVGVQTPDRYSSKMNRHWRTVRSGHSQFVLATHVGQLAVRREHRFFRHPVDFKSRRFETLCDISTNCCLATEDRLSRYKQQS